MRAIATCLLFLATMSGPAGAQDAGNLLFGEADTALDIVIAAPLHTLMRERPDKEELAGTATWTGVDGNPVAVTVDIRTRGNYRRQKDVCPFAPLRLDFRKKAVAGTLFDGQDKLKLVTHCKTGSRRSEQFLLREFLVYRMFNSLTDLSYRVRLLNVTWENTEAPGDTFVAPAFLIEHDRALAERSGLPEVALERTTTDRLDPEYASLASVFHYFIGNTDFSSIAGPSGETCCHNSTLFGAEGGPYFPVPYDFDMSGMVNADYANPNPRFGIRDVQTRLYRGRCRHNDYVAAALRRLKEQEAALYALVEGMDGLQNGSRRDMRRFMNDFFATAAAPDRVSKDILADCVG